MSMESILKLSILMKYFVNTSLEKVFKIPKYKILLHKYLKYKILKYFST